MKKVEDLKSFCQNLVQREGFILYDLVLGGGRRKNSFLRVFIDHKTRPITLEDCSSVSKALRWLLNLKNVLDIENYDLEVSSPGLERVLKEVWHYEEAVGKRIRIQLKRAYKNEYKEKGSKNGKILFRGFLEKVNPEGIFLKPQDKKDENCFFPFEQIQKASIIFNEFLIKKEHNRVSKRKRRKMKKKRSSV